MKKSISIFLIMSFVLVALLPIVAIGCTPRENTLRIYNWQEYIGADVIEQFEEYYFETTGEKVKVKYETFTTNEAMLNKLVGQKSDYDVICPSDYVIENLQRINMLNKIATDLGKDVNGNPIEDYRGNVSSMFKDLFDYDPNGEYSVPYMWGTMGITYNKANVSLSYLEEKGWAALWDSNYDGRITMKDSHRDSIAIGALYTFKNTNSKYYDASLSIDEVLNATSDDMIAKIQEMMQSQKSLLYGYEVDEGKLEIIDEKFDMLLQWSGDAAFSMWEANERKINNPNAKVADLGYFVPSEGSNIWSDGWCIPVNAVNTKAANLFINFMCRGDIAIANMDEILYTSSIASEEVIDYLAEIADEDSVETDLSYFFGETLGKNVKVNPIQYPSKNIIDKCAIMKDYGDRNDAMLRVWSEIKSA